MPRAAPLQAGINAGEFSPRMAARTDFDRYPLGCSVLENFLVLPQGGAARRPGTKFVAELKSSSVRGRLLPFVFSTIQAYVLEFGNLAVRFYKDQGRIVAADVTGSITNGTFDANVTGWDDRDSGGTAASAWNSAGYMELTGDGTEYAWREQAVAVTNGGVYTIAFRVRGFAGQSVMLRVGTASVGAQILGDTERRVGWHVQTFTATAATVYIQFRSNSTRAVGVDDVSIQDNVPVEVTTPFAEADLASIHLAQSADVAYLAHPSYRPCKLNRYGHPSWSLEDIFFADGPYLVANVTATTLTLSAATVNTSITVTASSIVGINGGEGFKTTDVGRLVRILHSTTWGYAEITAWTSTTVVTAWVKRAFGAATASATWRLGSWSDTTGWPQTLGFFQQRLVFAATSTQPQTLWLSQSADFENHEPDSVPSGGGARVIADDDALDYTIGADQVNAIRWIVGQKQMLVGTIGGEWFVTSSGAVVTPTDISVNQATSFGSANRQAVRMRGRAMYVQRARRKVFEFLFEFNLDNYASYDQTLLAEHITKGSLGEIAYQQEPDSVLWCVRDDGEIATLTYQPEQRVVGWARKIIGGTYLGEDAVAESVAAIPAATADEVWLQVKRTINGSTKRYVEVLAAPFETGDDRELAVLADSAVVLDDPKTITGATKADPVVITAAAHGFSNGDAVRIEDVVGMTQLNGNSYTIANVATDTFELTNSAGANINGTSYTTYVTGGEVRKKVSSVSGLSHLEGESVKVLADGAVHPARTVASGAITLDAAYSKVVAGFGYSHEYESLKWEAGAVAGTAQGQTKRIDGVALFLLNALNAQVGPDEDHMRVVPFRSVSDMMDAAVPLFTGEKFVEFDGNYALDTRVRIEGDDPVPFTLLGLSPHLKTMPR